MDKLQLFSADTETQVAVLRLAGDEALKKLEVAVAIPELETIEKSAKKALKDFSDFRKPITREIDSLKSLFIEEEKKVKVVIDAISETIKEKKRYELEKFNYLETLFHSVSDKANALTASAVSRLQVAKTSDEVIAIVEKIPTVSGECKFPELAEQEAKMIAEINERIEQFFATDMQGLMLQQLATIEEYEELKAQAIEKNETVQPIEVKQVVAPKIDLPMDKSILSKPEIKQAYKIEVSGKKAFEEIFAFWWKNEGCTYNVETLSKILERQIKFAESIANAHELKINSNNLEYKLIVK